VSPKTADSIHALSLADVLRTLGLDHAAAACRPARL
jgi:hypothetical protein